jgi:diguanylate cyclase (GGDEF)-like protein/PAS domain S-box-containing protein
MQLLINFFDLKNLVPHGYCLSWGSLLLWLHVISDALITLSYYSIPLSLLYFIRLRKDLPYPWLIVMFACFIVACGTTHLLAIITIWIPVYWLEAYLKVFTALISVASALAMFWVIPLALKLPSPAQLQAEIEQRKRSDKAQKETLERLQKIASRLPGMVCQFRLDADGSTSLPYCSEGIRDVFKLTPEQAYADVGLLSSLVHPDDYVVVLRTIQKSAQDLTLWLCEFRVLLNDGSEHWLLANALPERKDDGATLWYGFITEITERKQAENEILRTRNQLQATLDAIPDLLFEVDAQGRYYSYHAPQHSQLIVASHASFIGKKLTEILPLEAANVCLAALEEAQQQGWSVGKQFKLPRPEGDFWFELSVSAKYLEQNHNDSHFIVLSRDITQRKQAETELHIAATAFESQEAMVITDANSVILRINAAFTEITGYTPEEAIGQKINLLRSGRHDTAFYQAMWHSINSTGSWQGEIWDRRKNGEIYPKWLTITAVTGDDGQVSHYVGVHTDITERKATEEYINQLAFYDVLTQLPNRRLLQERMKHALEVSHRSGSQLAVLMMDLDKFKAVNDTLGHAAGDELLQQVAVRIKTCLRQVDMVARLGGDEFFILMEDVKGYEYVAPVAALIIQTLSQPFTLSQNQVAYIGASIGIAIHPEHGDNTEILMDHADAALYHAKDQGRGCFAYFSEELTQKARERVALELRLRRAIVEQELQVYFQPQIDISTGQVIGAEALVRWHDPVYGYQIPSSFISLAEETGLIMEIGEWVLRETCRQGRQWLDQGFAPLTLAVNVSPYQFSRCDINALVTQVLKDTRFPAEYLELEITESGLMENQEHAMTILNGLHSQGVRLAIDDFGTGYSSLAYLKYFPLDVLKIDKTFIDDIPFLAGDMAIAATIISMGHHLDFKVLAEGVETKEQLAFLRKQGCDMYQGYFCSKPVPAIDFETLLTDVTHT